MHVINSVAISVAGLVILNPNSKIDKIDFSSDIDFIRNYTGEWASGIVTFVTPVYACFHARVHNV